MKSSTPKRGVLPNNNLMNYFFEEDFKAIQSLKRIGEGKKKVQLLYPGCGSDILFPLFFVRKLFEPEQAKFVFVDKDNVFKLLCSVLQDIGVPHMIKGTKVEFYWENTKVKLEFRQEDIFKTIKKYKYDVYFERAFRIIKKKHEGYEQVVFKNLKRGGVLISDSGYRQFKLNEQIIAPELSPYGEMIMGIKAN